MIVTHFQRSRNFSMERVFSAVRRAFSNLFIRKPEGPATGDTGSRTWVDSAKLAVVRLADGFNALLVEMLHRLLFRKLRLPGDETSIRRILIFRIGNVGDIVAATPTIGTIRRRFPHAHICLLTSPGAKESPGARELVVPGSLVDALIVYYRSDILTWRGRKQLMHRIRSQRFDLFIDLSNVLAPSRKVIGSMVLARIAGCRYAAGFLITPLRWFARTQALRRSFRQESDRLFDTVSRTLDLQRDDLKQNESGLLPVSAADRSFVRGLLQGHGVSAHDRIVVLHVGGKRPANRWFEDRYAAVADWIQRQPGMRAVLTGVPSEMGRIERVRLHMRSQPVIVCGELNLLQTAALLEQACLYVGNDTGPMHIAAAVGTPAVAIFSARDFPQHWYPLGGGHVVLRRDVPCSPCFKHECDRGLTCLDLIQVDDVLQAVRLQLPPGQPGPPTEDERCAV